MAKSNKWKEKIDFRYNLSLYFKFLKKYRLLFVILLFIILTAEVIRLVDKFLFKVIVDKGTIFSAGTISAETFVKILIIVAIVYVSARVIGSLFGFFRLHAVNRLESGLIADIKRHFFGHLLHLDYNFHVTHKTGSLISKITRVGRAVERMSDVIIFNFMPMFFQLIVVSVSFVYFSWTPAIITIATVAIFISYSFAMQRIQEKANIEANRAEDFEKANIADILTNIESIKYFGKEEAIKHRFRIISEATKRNLLKFWDYFRWLDAIQTLILAVGTFLLIYFPLVGFLHGKESLGTIVFIYTVFSSLLGSLFGFGHGIRNYYQAMADFESIFKYAKVENAIRDKANAKEARIKEGRIKFESICFEYGRRKIFENFDLEIEPNQKIALVGHSGSGKTTLIRLLFRFYDVDRGRILIDNWDIRGFRQESLRSEMAIVPQECILFDDTIYNNIAFSNPSASKEGVMKAIRFAQLDNIIARLPYKEKTIVGERGVKLSAGEKQRVSIARAILANKRILVLDEATSSLDSETEHEIQKALWELMKGRTTLIIAHRLSTIMKADKIIVLERGKIVQAGPHNKLIRRLGIYRKLWELQKGGYIK